MYIEDLLSCNLLEHEEDVADITDSADKQKKIENNLREIDEYWAISEFDFGTKGKREQLLMLKGGKVTEILEKLEED